MREGHRWLTVMLLGETAAMLGLVAIDAGGAQPTPSTVAGRTLSEWSAQLKSSNRTVRRRAVLTLGAFGPRAVSALTGALKDDNPAVRYWAASRLGDIGPPARSARPVLKRLLIGKSFAVRLSAAYALCRLGDIQTGLPILIKGLTVADKGTNVSTADFLARIGPPAKAAVPALKNAIAEEKRQKRRSVIHVARAAEEALRRIAGGTLP